MQADQANASGRMPVVFVHGLWLLPSSWNAWASLFEEAGYAPVTPGWPDDPETVAEARAHPEAFAGKTVARVADHLAGVIGALTRKPAVIGHSFGGLLAQILAGRGLSAVSVAIDPALTIDGGRREVAETALAFVQRFAPASGSDGGAPA